MSGASSKGVLLPYLVVTAGSMAASITSLVTNIQYMDDVVYQIQWTGTPVGTFTVQVSEDYQQSGGTVLNAGTWTTLTLSSAITAAGSADQAILDLNQLPYSWIRLVYTRTSGTGTLNAYISAKAV